jgi:hypothetical protein
MGGHRIFSAGPGRSIGRNAGVIVAVGAMVWAISGTVPARAGTGMGFVRVNQLGYAAGSQAKRAYLMASAAETGARFSVKNFSGTTV